MKTTEKIIIAIIEKYAKTPMKHDSLLSSANLNEMDTIMIFIETEKAFNIEVPGVDELEFHRVDEYVEYIHNLINQSKNIGKLN